MPKVIPESLLVKTIVDTFIDASKESGLIRLLVITEGRAAQEKIRFALQATLRMPNKLQIAESTIETAVEEIYKQLAKD